MLPAVTGATGQLGSRVARLIAGRELPQVLVGRRPDELPDLPGAERRGPAAYDEPEAMGRALTGVSDLLLVSANLSGRRLEEHVTATEAAVRAGVERIVYVSLHGSGPAATYLNARDHWQTEQYLAAVGSATGLRWTVVRAGLYAVTLLRLADEAGVIRGPAAGGRVSLLAHDDLARVCAAVLTDGGEHDGRVLTVTGPEALTLAEAAGQLQEGLGRPFRYEPETVAEAWERFRRDGRRTDREAAWISWYMAIAAGEVDEVTDTVARLTGRPALSVRDTVAGG